MSSEAIERTQWSGRTEEFVWKTCINTTLDVEFGEYEMIASRVFVFFSVFLGIPQRHFAHLKTRYGGEGKLNKM